ncbi:MAG TPA: hypothetical protein VFI20_08500 [Terracidiphilus sp.]|nr:hypothetical protein [Terracidiphilus sp.]
MHIHRMYRSTAAFSVSLALMLMLSFAGCKSSTSTADNTAQNPAPPAGAAADSSAAQSGSAGSAAPARNRRSAPGSSSASQPAPRPAPVTLTVESGQDIHVRVNETLSSKVSNVGDGFTGELTAPLTTRDGAVVIPKGAQVSGDVVASKGQGRFKGSGVLAIALKEVDGHPVDATEYVVSQKGKGKRSTALIGGGAGAGALIGGLAGGGKGALIGGLVGGGAGTAGAAYTGNKELIIRSESVVVFALSQPLSVTTQQ